ncbi:MAG: hypothetical protein BGN95_04730 [Sphingomonas sp. 66-10]|nr:MAG: hypothetical protein BGN95_04730 [Sphingomonas sp. 66-10]
MEPAGAAAATRRRFGKRWLSVEPPHRALDRGLSPGGRGRRGLGQHGLEIVVLRHSAAPAADEAEDLDPSERLGAHLASLYRPFAGRSNIL